MRLWTTMSVQRRGLLRLRTTMSVQRRGLLRLWTTMTVSCQTQITVLSTYHHQIQHLCSHGALVCLCLYTCMCYIVGLKRSTPHMSLSKGAHLTCLFQKEHTSHVSFKRSTPHMSLSKGIIEVIRINYKLPC